LHRPIPQPPPVLASSVVAALLVVGSSVVAVEVVVVVGSAVVLAPVLVEVVGGAVVVVVVAVCAEGPPHTPASQRRLGPQSASEVQGWPERKPPVKQALSASAQATRSGRAIIGSIDEDMPAVQRLPTCPIRHEHYKLRFFRADLRLVAVGAGGI
jgi:hypothetical protein